MEQNSLGAKPEIHDAHTPNGDPEIFTPGDDLRSAWYPLLRWKDADSEHYWEPVTGTSCGFKFRWLNEFTALGSDGSLTLYLTLEKITIQNVVDPTTKKLVQQRVPAIVKSVDGRLLQTGLAHLPAARFVQEYRPSGSWLSNSEWREILTELGPLAESERTLLANERASEDRRGRENAAAELVAKNSTAILAEMARALAKGKKG